MKVQVVFTICTVIFILRLSDIVSSLVQQNTFHPITDCICQQHVITYECRVCGLATAWEGTALDSCSGGEIALTTTDFINPIQTIICNGGTIAARGILVEGGCFTSQLNITFNTMILQGRTVRCSVDNGTHASQIGIDVLALSTEPYSPPKSVNLIEVSSSGLLFSWNQTQNCPSLRYNVLSENCGLCPNTTAGTSVNCSDFTISNSITLCTFSVQTVICGNNGIAEPLVGNLSDLVTANLTVPTINQVTTIPHYHIEDGLRGLTVLFSAVEPFIIYEDINGTATSYTIYYSDSVTGEICHSNEINSMFCDNGICIDEFDVSSSSCQPSSDINVTISAVTNLGEGPSTVPAKEEHQNNFVRVRVISELVSINCAFLNTSKETTKLCGATVTYGDNCEEQIQINGVRDSDNNSLIIISLTSFLEGPAIMTICGFRVNATANTRTVTVDGNLVAISINNQIPTNRSAIVAAALVPIFILMVAIFITILGFTLCFRLKIHQKSRNFAIPLQSVNTKFKIIPVTKECNIVDFAKENFDNYDANSGNGYYQFIKTAEEYIPPKTRVLLVSEDKMRVCPDRQARKILGISDKREKVKLPDLSNSEWRYAFIQSTSRIRILPEGSLFMYYESSYDGSETERPKTPLKRKEADNLKLIADKYIKLKKVPGDREYPILEFVQTMEGLANYNPELGYGFYEFTKPMFIRDNKQVIMMDQNEQLYYGPDARREIGIEAGYDETEERRPNFDTKRWKRAFIQTHSKVKILQPNTWFLHCDIASFEMIRVLEPYKLFTVTEDGQKLISFAKEKVTYYNSRAGYGYYEFTEPCYVISKRNIMALTKNGELYTGPGVRHLICANGDYDETILINPPDLSETDWECIFIQGKRGYGRLLPKSTRFLYCEYDYRPKD